MLLVNLGTPDAPAVGTVAVCPSLPVKPSMDSSGLSLRRAS